MSIRGGIRLQLKDSPLFGFTVAVASAVNDGDKDAALNMLCDSGHALAPITSVYTCSVCANTDTTTFHKGKFRDGQAIVVPAEELAAARAVDPAEYKYLSFECVSAVDVDHLSLPAAKPYFLELGNKGEGEHYATMVELVLQTPDVAYICTFALKGAPKMYRLGVYENALTIQPLAWPADIRQAPANTAPAPKAYVEQAKMLVGLTTKPFEPTMYVNDRTARVLAVVDAASPMPAVVDAGKAKAAVVAPADALASSLAAAVAAAKAAQAPAKKSPAKRAPAKRKATAGKP